MTELEVLLQIRDLIMHHFDMDRCYLGMGVGFAAYTPLVLWRYFRRSVDDIDL